MCFCLFTTAQASSFSSSHLSYMYTLTPSSKSWLCFWGISSAPYSASCLEKLGKKPCLNLITPLFSTGWDFKPVKICMIGFTDCFFQWCCLVMANGFLSEKANVQDVNSNRNVQQLGFWASKLMKPDFINCLLAPTFPLANILSRAEQKLLLSQPHP